MEHRRVFVEKNVPITPSGFVEVRAGLSLPSVFLFVGTFSTESFSVFMKLKF